MGVLECPKCGASVQSDKQIKCNFCGLAFHLTGGTTLFYSKDNVSVSDTVFTNREGDQFPIRNLSSVSIKSIVYFKTLLSSIFLLLVGIVSIVFAFNDALNEKNASKSRFHPNETQYSIFDYLHIDNSIYYFFGLGFLLLISWFFVRKYRLFIGSAGTLQVGIDFPMWKSGSLQALEDIKSAINESINNLQSTKD